VFYSHQRLQDARCKQISGHPRKARLHRGWRLLRDGQGVFDFARRHKVHIAKAFYVVCAKSNKQFVVVQAFPVPHQHVLDKLSVYLAEGKQVVLPIFRTDSASDLHRSGNRQDPRAFEQQNGAFCIDYFCTLQTALAGRVVFHMDKTVSAHQGVLLNDLERSQDAKMDCHHYLRVVLHRQKEFELGSFFV
jgi:hypothetical protein